MSSEQEAIRRALAERDSQIRAFIARIERFFSIELDNVLTDLDFGSQSGYQAAAALGQLETALIDAGLGDELKALRAIYGTELREIKRTFAAAGIAETDIFAGVDSAVINALIDADFEKVTKNLSAHVSDVKAVLTRSVLSVDNVPTGKLIAGENERLSRYLNTEIDTMYSAFTRTVTAKKADDLGFELMRYLGPDDKITRPFCKRVLKDKEHPGAIYKIEEIKKLDNKQGLDVLTYGGGYNCRHQWRPITIERARELGFNG